MKKISKAFIYIISLLIIIFLKAFYSQIILIVLFLSLIAAIIIDRVTIKGKKIQDKHRKIITTALLLVFYLYLTMYILIPKEIDGYIGGGINLPPRPDLRDGYYTCKCIGIDIYLPGAPSFQPGCIGKVYNCIQRHSFDKAQNN